MAQIVENKERQKQVWEIQQAIIQTAKRVGLQPYDALNVIGQAVSDVVITISELAGQDPLITLRVFGQSIISAADNTAKQMAQNGPIN